MQKKEDFNDPYNQMDDDDLKSTLEAPDKESKRRRKWNRLKNTMVQKKAQFIGGA